MMKTGKSSVLTLADKCKNILASNWQGNLNTIKCDERESEEIYSSKVKYFVKKGKPYLWVPETELHDANIIVDNRGSFAVTSPFPGPLGHILRSIKKLPARVALVGDVVRLGDEKAKFAAESLRETLLADQKTVKESTYAVSGILSASNVESTSRSANLQELLQGVVQYSIYRFNLSSCMYFDIDGKAHHVKPEDIEKSKTDRVARFSMGLIDGINQSEMRRRALVLLCIAFQNENAKDAFVLSVDRKGFDVLAKVMGSMNADGFCGCYWKELRFTFQQEASDVERFGQQLVKMEDEAMEKLSSITGI